MRSKKPAADRSLAAFKAWTTMRQRDEQVLVNIPADEQALWTQLKSSIKGPTPHARFEAFTKYVEEHPGEVVAALQDDADAQVDALVAARNAADAADLAE